MSDIILVIDDNEGVRQALAVLFSVHGLTCISAASVEEGLSLLDSQPIGLVVQDMNFTGDTTSGTEGIDLFNRIRERSPDLPVILLTAWTHLETAVELVRAGAADYLAKPWDDEKLVASARNLLELNDATARDRASQLQRRERRQALENRYDLCATVFESLAMHEVITIATRIAGSDLPVLVTGPNGAGKEKIADIVHRNSAVRNGPLVKVNVGALPAELIESELFGAEAGAYTGANSKRVGHFEAANQGSLFLDEIGNLSLTGQAKLLRVLQTGEFQRLGSSETRHSNVRIISATNVDLQDEVRAGRFREDLYYRLNVIELEVPALKSRGEDILPLAYHFLPPGKCFDNDAEAALISHSWPGNVRELQNTIRRAALLSQGDAITRADLGLADAQRPDTDVLSFEPDANAIILALETWSGNVSRAASELGLSRQALYRRMSKFGIQKN